MKLYYYVLAGAIFLTSSTIHCSETAHATAVCYSLRCQRGVDPNGVYYLDFSSLSGSLNGELAPDFFASGYTHSTYLSLTDELLGETLPGQMVLDVPDGGDANGDGFVDFFQVSQGITNVPSSGAYNLQLYGNGSLTANWNRAAGSKDGFCVLSMRLMALQPVSFSVPFEVREYTGPLSYATSSTNVTGALRWEQTGNSNSLLNGSIWFVKSATDRFNLLTLQPGVWTNESQQTMAYAQNAFYRDVRWPTNYYGSVEFDDDANPATFSPYSLWELSIDDLNDSNHNGIPDFSDDPGASLPRRPSLELLKDSKNLVIALHGDVGHRHEIQALSDLGSTNWQTYVSLVLTNDPQQVSLAAPTGGAGFWRVRAQ